MSATMIELECEFCHNKFDRVKSEHTRNQKKGRKVFCSLSCTAKQNHIDRPSQGYPESLVGHYNNRYDEYSCFRKYLRSARSRFAKNGRKAVGLTLQDLKEQWEKQKGICPYTGWELELPITSSRWKKDSEEKLRASIDRIDSSKGYVKGNVQFVAQMANWAKNNYTDKDLIEFCEAVVDNK